jgi:LuxR family transcriptional regulator, maltose regulon positive regulatory protein
LLVEWVSQIKIPAVWLSLGKSDNDPVYFIRYFIASLQTIEPNIGKTILSVLQSPHRPTIESIMKSLIKEIADFSNNFVLVFDDYHLIDTENIHNIVEFLLDYLPAHIRLVIAIRIDSPLSLKQHNNISLIVQQF